MKKILFLTITGVALVGSVCIWLLAKNKPAEQMLVTTYAPEYTIFGVAADAYTVRSGQMDETLTAEKEQGLPICNFEYSLLYNEQTDKFYNVKFEEKGRPAIPDFIEAKELNTYKLELPDAGTVENLSLKRNSDSPVVISSKDDVENILDILENNINADFISKGNVICRLFYTKMRENILSSKRGMGDI